jgi:hypothetical protein
MHCTGQIVSFIALALCLSCSGDAGSTSDSAASQSGRTIQIAGVETVIPDGVSTELARQLAERLEAVVATPTAVRVGSGTEVGQTAEVEKVEAGQTYAVWQHSFPGDYNTDGLVNSDDLMRLALYFGWTTGREPGSWQNLAAIDGDGNGELNIADVVPIGLNFGRQADYYILEYFDPAQEIWFEFARVVLDKGDEKSKIEKYQVRIGEGSDPALAWEFRALLSDGDTPLQPPQFYSAGVLRDAEAVELRWYPYRCDSIEIYRDSLVEPLAVVSGDDTSYVDRGAQDYLKHDYWLRAVRDGERSSYSQKKTGARRSDQVFRTSFVQYELDEQDYSLNTESLAIVDGKPVLVDLCSSEDGKRKNIAYISSAVEQPESSADWNVKYIFDEAPLAGNFPYRFALVASSDNSPVVILAPEDDEAEIGAVTVIAVPEAAAITEGNWLVYGLDRNFTIYRNFSTNKYIALYSEESDQKGGRQLHVAFALGHPSSIADWSASELDLGNHNILELTEPQGSQNAFSIDYLTSERHNEMRSWHLMRADFDLSSGDGSLTELYSFELEKQYWHKTGYADQDSYTMVFGDIDKENWNAEVKNLVLHAVGPPPYEQSDWQQSLFDPISSGLWLRRSGNYVVISGENILSVPVGLVTEQSAWVGLQWTIPPSFDVELVVESAYGLSCADLEGNQLTLAYADFVDL